VVCVWVVCGVCVGGVWCVCGWCVVCVWLVFRVLSLTVLFVSSISASTPAASSPNWFEARSSVVRALYSI
jgi:hypothetical protein